MGKKNKYSKESGDPPKENKPPDNKGAGAGAVPVNSGNQQKTESKQPQQGVQPSRQQQGGAGGGGSGRGGAQGGGSGRGGGAASSDRGSSGGDRNYPQSGSQPQGCWGSNAGDRDRQQSQQGGQQQHYGGDGGRGGSRGGRGGGGGGRGAYGGGDGARGGSSGSQQQGSWGSNAGDRDRSQSKQGGQQQHYGGDGGRGGSRDGGGGRGGDGARGGRDGGGGRGAYGGGRDGGGGGGESRGGYRGGDGARGGRDGGGSRGGYGGGDGGRGGRDGGGGRGAYGGGRDGGRGGGGGGRGGYGGGGGGGYGASGGGGREENNAVVRVPKPATSIPRGTAGQNFEVQTNYLKLDLSNMPDVAYHYDVKIDPDRPKKFIRPAFDAYVRKVFPNYNLAYDGRANAYSAVLLPSDKLGSEITVEVDERDRKVPFKVTLKATDDIEIDLKSLKSSSYHTERIFDKPMRALQCIEVVLSTPCHEIGVRAGRSFFRAPERPIDLGDGFELWYGLYQAAMLCDQPLLNVDVSHKSFPTKVNLDVYYENLRYQNPRELTDFLKGLRVKYKPPACFKGTEKEFKFVKVMDTSSRQTFKTDDGKQLTVEQYFQSKGYKLRKPNLPCLHVGSTVKNIYIPLELLEVPPGQAIMRKDTENQVRQMIRYAATSTDVRKDKIMELLRKFNYYTHPTVERFGISVDRSFITVSARLLQSPVIEYQGRNIVIERPGEWMNRGVRFYKCDKNIHQWAIINISQKSDINALFLREHFIEKIGKEAQRLGMNLAPNCFDIKEISSQRNREAVSILADLKKYKTSKVSIVFVILPFNAESYARVKQEAEISCGIVTQCIKGETMRSYNKKFNSDKIIDQMTIGNILLKVNAKLNGTNHKISPANEISLQKAKVMFVGADVSHPSPLQTNLPSIVGVVASHDLNGTQYNMQYRLQTAKLETIEDMQNIMTQHLNVFKTFTGTLPEHVIYYRDGVSDGQFPLIKQIEVNAMRAACKQMKCVAKFTVIIVVKRHHTRFFPKSMDGEGKFNNVKAGTVVDQTICHPNETQFFMVSHKAIQGTSKPTRYNVIIDDAKINIDDLQALTYNLCHLFPRCNRSVSYPAPAYLAHLVGLRGRAYIEGSNLNLENLKVEYNKRVVNNDIMRSNPMYFV